MQIGKNEVKRSVFADDMIFYIENPNESTKKTVELINEFSKVAVCKDQYSKFSCIYLHSNERN